MSGDPDALGKDGTVRLRCCAIHASTRWSWAGCSGCGRQVPIGARAAIDLRSGEAAVGQFAGRLRWSGCGGGRVTIQIRSDRRTGQRDAPPPATRAAPWAAETMAALAHDPGRVQERVRAALAETWQTSPLGAWLTEHHDEVARLLRGRRGPPWDRLAAGFAAAGLLDARGRGPDAETTRLTWEAVRAARRAADG